MNEPDPWPLRFMGLVMIIICSVMTVLAIVEAL